VAAKLALKWYTSAILAHVELEKPIFESYLITNRKRKKTITLRNCSLLIIYTSFSCG